MSAHRLQLPDGSAIELHPRAAEHTLFGPCDVIADAHGRPLARVAAVDWDAPRWIPALDVPGALPPGAGSAVLNLLATRARSAGALSLRYRGPYPTVALFDTLRGSFAIPGDVDALRERFTADVEQAAFAGRAIEPAVDFVPDPHRWSWPDPRICAQHRHGLERLWIEGRAWDRDGTAPRRLRRGASSWHAVFEIDGEPWCTVASVDDDGRPVAPLACAPALPAGLLGLELPDAARAVLLDALLAGAIAALHPAITAIVRARALVFGDSGYELAIVEPTRIVLHAALAERLERIAPARSLALLVGALHPCVCRAAQAAIAAAAGGNRRRPGVDPAGDR